MAIRVISHELSLKLIEELIKVNESLKEKLRGARESLSVLSSRLNDFYLATEQSSAKEEFKASFNEVPNEGDIPYSKLRKKLERKDDTHKNVIKMIEMIRQDFNDFISVSLYKHFRNYPTLRKTIQYQPVNGKKRNQLVNSPFK